MKWSTFSDEQILGVVKEGETGRKVADLCRGAITEPTYYRWKAKYGGMELTARGTSRGSHGTDTPTSNPNDGRRDRV